MMEYFNKRIKKLDVWDIALTKLSVLIFALFLVGVWPALRVWVDSRNPWCCVAAFVIVVARPIYRFYLKK